MLWLLHFHLISVKSKSKQQRINTVTLFLRHISTPLVGVLFKRIYQIQEQFLQKLKIFSVMASLVPQCTFNGLLILLSKSCHVVFFTKLPLSRFIFDLLLSHFDLLISRDFLIFLLLYLDSLDNVFWCNQFH